MRPDKNRHMLIIMLKRLNRWAAPAMRLAIVALVALWPAVALAQAAAPPPALRRTPAPWIGMMIMAVLLALVLTVSLMPSKRSHQD